MSWRRLLVIACITSAAQAADNPQITILDGSATVVEGARRFAAVSWQALPDRALVETAATARLLRIEWPDGQAVDLGPATRVMLAPPPVGGRDHPAAAVYVLQGWIKLSSPAKGPGNGLISVQFELMPFAGSVVGFVGAAEVWLFAESGGLTMVERGRDAPTKLSLRAGSAYTRAGSEKGMNVARPEAAALQRVPRAFRDPLPLRYDTLKARNAKPQPLPAPTYAQLQDWLGAEKAVREGFVPRFDELLRDRQFRRDLAGHLREHREWHSVLYPPPPKPVSPPASVPARR